MQIEYSDRIYKLHAETNSKLAKKDAVTDFFC